MGRINEMKNLKKYIASCLMILALVMCTGCGYLTYTTNETADVIGGGDGPTSIIVATQPESSAAGSSEVASTESVVESAQPSAEAESTETVVEVSTEPVSTEPELIDPDGSYTTCEDVALYLETYGELPGNFITKNEARELGWEGGSLEPYAPGKCIGGDKFGNREGLLPKEQGRTYRECDIDTLGAKSRGAKRIVYSNDGLIYYTDDHYESFTLLYE